MFKDFSLRVSTIFYSKNSFFQVKNTDYEGCDEFKVASKIISLKTNIPLKTSNNTLVNLVFSEINVRRYTSKEKYKCFYILYLNVESNK